MDNLSGYPALPRVLLDLLGSDPLDRELGDLPPALERRGQLPGHHGQLGLQLRRLTGLPARDHHIHWLGHHLRFHLRLLHRHMDIRE